MTSVSPVTPTIEQSSSAFLAGGGEMGEPIRSLDWSATPLGPIDTWPQSLLTAISMMLPSKAQIVAFWGPEFVVIYNDAYRPVFGAKHPSVLGQPGRVAWKEIWDDGANLHGLLDGVVRTGEAFSARDLLFVLERHGFVEETYFDVSYDPVRVESGDVGGVYCIVSETTGRVVGERRLALLRDLAAHNASARTARDACILAMQTFAAQPHDIRFALAYIDGELQAATPGAEGAFASADPSLVRELSFGTGRLVVGINRQRPFDDLYRAFLDLVADQIGTAVANAQAYDDERKRVEALAELDRAKTQFFSNVSHEFRTPLTLMLGPVEESLADTDESLTPKQRERQEMVRRNALRLLKMVNTLLDFSRIEAQRAQPAFEATDLAAYTAELASTFRSTIEKAGLRLTVDVAPLGGDVLVDADMWEKIVLNLLSNAYKFTLAGEIGVSLRAADSTIELEVRDTGGGIPEADLPRIFQRFHRVEGTPGRTQEGTGIGLALVQELVHLHDGEITVTSVLDAGSTFRVRIPRRSPASAAPRATTRPARRNSGAEYIEEAERWQPGEDLAEHEEIEERAGRDTPQAASPRAARILLADDNADMREYVTRLLKQEDYEVEAVADGRAALDAAHARRPDLVLADVMMPGMDGFELLDALRRDPRTRELPIVLLSARAGEEARIAGIQSGADDYLVKPFSARELLARVDAHVRMAQVRRAASARMREIFLRAPAIIATLRGPQHVFESANPHYLELIGRGDEILGHPLAEVLPEVVEQGFITLLDEVYRTGEPYAANGVPVTLNRGGKGHIAQVFLNFVYQPLFDAGGSVSGIFVHAVDVTTQVRARTLLEQQASELEEARARAEDANRAKASFLATMSHELRTPLNAIMGYRDLLDAEISGPLTTDQRGQLQRIDLASRHLLQMIEEILTFSRLEAGREVLRLEKVDVVRLAMETCKLVEPLATQKALSFGCESPQRIEVETDPGKLRQILLNLLSNAIKFTDRGEVRLCISEQPESVLFEVCDTGVGIAEGQIDRIFEPFHQAPTPSARRPGGTGLGLTVSRELARLLGGDVSVTSSPGQGSTFALCIPDARGGGRP
jgi:signal transduction histidine kinase